MLEMVKLERMLEMSKKYLFQSFITFVDNFLSEIQNLKQIFGHGSKIDFPIFISSKFFEKK